MKRILCSVLAALAIATPSLLRAQSFETGWFLDNFSYSHRYNPAMHCESNMLGVLVSDIEVYTGSNTGVSSFFFPRNGRLVNGFNKQVSAAEFLSRLSPVSTVDAVFGYNVATYGFWNKEKTAYHIAELNVKGFTSGNLPKEIFEFLKVGSQGRSFDIVGTDVVADTYAELSYGYSRHISNWQIGGRVKLLLGVGQAQFKADHLYASNSGGVLHVQSDAAMQIALSAMQVPLKPDGSYDFEKATFNSRFGLPGIGFGIDLGATYKPFEGFEASLAVIDLGGISWKQNITGKADGSVDIENLSSKDGDAVVERLRELLKMTPTGEKRSFRMLPFTVNAGLRYAMPFYNRFSAGLSFTYRNYLNPYCSGRFGLTVTPVDWFSFTANYGYGTYGNSLGGAFSITGGAFNFYLGVETYLGERMADAPLPTGRFKTALNLGITFRL